MAFSLFGTLLNVPASAQVYNQLTVLGAEYGSKYNSFSSKVPKRSQLTDVGRSVFHIAQIYVFKMTKHCGYIVGMRCYMSVSALVIYTGGGRVEA